MSHSLREIKQVEILNRKPVIFPRLFYLYRLGKTYLVYRLIFFFTRKGLGIQQQLSVSTKFALGVDEYVPKSSVS
jgi:hypothetical protein